MTSPLRVRQLAAAIARFARALIGRNGSESGVDASGGADGANPNRNAIRAQRILRPIALRFGPRARHGNPPVPAGHVALGHAWRLLLVDGAEWGVALGTQDMHLQSSIAARLGPMLASGKIAAGAIERAGGRMWWAPKETWGQPVRFMGRKRMQAEVACAGHDVLVPLPKGGLIRCTAFVSRRDLAIAFGATKPPQRNSAGVAGVRELVERYGDVRPGARKRGRPTYKDGYVADARNRYHQGGLSGSLEEEIDLAVKWIAARPHLDMVQADTIARNLRKEFDEGILPRRSKPRRPAQEDCD